MKTVKFDAFHIKLIGYMDALEEYLYGPLYREYALTLFWVGFVLAVVGVLNLMDSPNVSVLPLKVSIVLSVGLMSWHPFPIFIRFIVAPVVALIVLPVAYVVFLLKETF